MFYLIFKMISPASRIFISNLKDDIDKSTLSKFGDNLKDLLGDMSKNYFIVIVKLELHEDYVRHIFRNLLSWTNSTLNIFIEIAKDD